MNSSSGTPCAPGLFGDSPPPGTRPTAITDRGRGIATTVMAMEYGGHEQNPLVARFMLVGTLQGLMWSKLVVLAVAVAIIRYRGFRVIRLANFAFAAIVCWNIFVIVLLALQPHRT